MATKLGCLKPVLLGCLGLILILIIGGAIIGIIAKRGVDKQQVEDRELAPQMVQMDDSLRGSGRVILELAQGEFQIKPARPGEGVSIQARYDVEAYELVDDLQTLPDSSWLMRLMYPLLRLMRRAVSSRLSPARLRNARSLSPSSDGNLKLFGVLFTSMPLPALFYFVVKDTASRFPVVTFGLPASYPVPVSHPSRAPLTA